MRVWGALTGVMGMVDGLSAVVPALSFGPPVFNISLLAWLITLGLILRPDERFGTRAGDPLTFSGQTPDDRGGTWPEGRVVGDTTSGPGPRSGRQTGRSSVASSAAPPRD